MGSEFLVSELPVLGVRVNTVLVVFALAGPMKNAAYQIYSVAKTDYARTKGAWRELFFALVSYGSLMYMLFLPHLTSSRVAFILYFLVANLSSSHLSNKTIVYDCTAQDADQVEYSALLVALTAMLCHIFPPHTITFLSVSSAVLFAIWLRFWWSATRDICNYLNLPLLTVPAKQKRGE